MLLVLLLVAVIWAVNFDGSPSSVDRARRSSVEANRAAMRGEVGSWKEIPTGLSEPTRPEIKEGPRGGRYTEAKTKEGRPYRRYF